jgi:pimeloyl-ACP methyl ester carboxylesterase
MRLRELNNIDGVACMRTKLIALALALCTSCLTWAGISSERHPISIESYVRLGGIDQWVTGHGADRSNPVIIVVHGGPGEAQWPLAAEYAAWESSFTVVQWDQRGAGRTFERNGTSTQDVNLEQITRDGIELIERIRHITHKHKVILLGHSWGSIVAVKIASARPNVVAAYVGTGQVASWSASVHGQFDFLLRYARAHDDNALETELEDIGTPDPSNANQYFKFTRSLRGAICDSDKQWLASLPGKAKSSGQVSEKDFAALVGGMDFSGPLLLKDQMSTDLLKSNSSLQVPFFVIQGREDMFTPTNAAMVYFAWVKAPYKKLVIIEHAGHFAFLTHKDQFLKALIEEVRPAAIRRQA